MIRIHKTAEVDDSAKIQEGTVIWHQAQIREGVKIGKNCILGKGVYIDKNVIIGDNVKIQNYSSIYHNSIIEDGVFIGPYVCLTNDRYPRATTATGELKEDDSWTVGTTLIKKGASIGAGSVILPNITIGEYALIGASSLVTKDIERYGLAYGNPASIVGIICKCGTRLATHTKGPKKLVCKTCQSIIHYK